MPAWVAACRATADAADPVAARAAGTEARSEPDQQAGDGEQRETVLVVRHLVGA
jgi:hypothetical protein